MSVFGRKSEDEEYDEEYEVEERRPRKIRDLNPRNKRKRKEPPKPWGKKERLIVLVILLVSVVTSSTLAVSARDFKLPGFPRFSLDLKDLKFNFFKGRTIIIGGGTPEQVQSADEIVAKFESVTKKLSGTYALYVIDLNTSYSFGIDEEKVMQAASLIKLPVMHYVQGKVDDSKLEAMGKRSDNTVFIEMRDTFGDEELQKYIFDLGMTNTSIAQNETTPKEIGDLFKKIYLDKNEKLLGYLTDTIYENWLTKGVPNDIRVSHKYGREVHVVNDAGIIYSENPYIVVIMTEGVIENEADRVFPELSKLVYDGLDK